MSKHARIWLPCVALAVVVVAIAAYMETFATQPVATSDLSQRLAAFERAVEAKRKELGVAGAALAIVKDDKVIYQKAYGRRDFYFNRSVTLDTLFPIASASKSFTAMALLIGDDEKRLSLKDSPKKYLPYFKLRDSDADAKITLRELLTHSSGLPSSNWTWYHGALTREELVRIVADIHPTAKLGQRWQYSNNMYTAAGEALGRANDTTWEQVVAERLFKPLRMNATVATTVAFRNSSDFARGYYALDFVALGRWPVAMPTLDSSSIAPAGGIASSARDMAQWLRFLLGRGQLEDRRLISEQAFAEAFRKHMTLAAIVGGRQLHGYGLGWFLGERGGYDIVEHGGDLPGFTSLVYLVPEQNLGLAVLTNQSSSALPGSVVDLVWSHLAAGPRPRDAGSPKRPPTRGSAQTAPDEVAGREIMAKAVAAAGGERLRRHGRMTILADVDLESQGLAGKRVLVWTAPGRPWRWINWTPGILTATTPYMAFGKTVFTEHISFNGGGWSRDLSGIRTLAPDGFFETYDPLDWTSVYATVALVGRVTLNGEEAYKILKVTKEGGRIFDYVSPASFLVLKRETSSGGDNYSQTFHDYKEFEGVKVSTRIVSDDPVLGRTVMRVSAVKLRE